MYIVFVTMEKNKTNNFGSIKADEQRRIKFPDETNTKYYKVFYRHYNQYYDIVYYLSLLRIFLALVQVIYLLTLIQCHFMRPEVHPLIHLSFCIVCDEFVAPILPTNSR